MKNIMFILIVFLMGHGVARAQSNDANVDFSMGFGNGFAAPAISWSQSHPVLLNGKFRLGYGVRTTFFFGSKLDYVTAPGSVTEGNFFKAQNEEKMDTLALPNPNTNSINAAIYLLYQLNDKWSFGFNIDLIGFTFGNDQAGVFRADSQNGSVNEVMASPTNFNLLLTGDYDIGSLNSEFYGQYQISEQLGIRAGLSFVFSEYTTDQPLTFDNDRFRNKSLGGLLAVNYRF